MDRWTNGSMGCMNGWIDGLMDISFRVNMEDLREKTHYQHYELYRKKRLEEMGFEDNTG